MAPVSSQPDAAARNRQIRFVVASAGSRRTITVVRSAAEA
jgi:hypothetical protein